MSKETAKKQNGANKEKSTTVVIAILGVCFFIGAIVLVLSLMGIVLLIVHSMVCRI